jgi:hypothetical protein
MSDRHDHRYEHGHAPGPAAEKPTMSLLRLSAWQRLAGAGLMLAVMWLAVIATISQGS